MSATAITFTSTPTSPGRSYLSLRSKNLRFFKAMPTWSSISSSPQSLCQILFKVPYVSFRRTSSCNGFKRVAPVMEWQDCTVKKEVDVPASVAYACYSDREAIPRWMPFISSVKILEDKPDLSRWSLKYKAFGRDIEFSWLARNMQPTPNQKIHWQVSGRSP
ncbi:Polyketide cyclase / dehydrase and lipid transport protein [Quillaja saponaria]|uniref:Polyketide cyclase / dehydrase and lipid transport protein n=1 Tax=Quillaja saponaria TaxID=32244 RepID=A0AAD7VEQ7_QUISA|nr:Polyketide cyclase / dehydrase and lipid transport protein [Quillaja saponaria]